MSSYFKNNYIATRHFLDIEAFFWFEKKPKKNILHILLYTKIQEEMLYTIVDRTFLLEDTLSIILLLFSFKSKLQKNAFNILIVKEKLSEMFSQFLELSYIHNHIFTTELKK